MLVLTRKQDERIQIGDNIWVTVVKVNRNNVRIGIEAPGPISILRGELLLDGEELLARSAWEGSVENLA